MLEKIKVLLGISGMAKDVLLNVYIEQVKSEIEAYTEVSYIEAMENLVVQMVVEKYNKRFYEGIASSSTNGLSSSFKDGYSKEVMLQLDKLKKKVKFY